MVELLFGFGVFFLLTLLGQEIFMTMISAVVAMILIKQMGADSIQIIPQTMMYGVESLELAAIPLFILAGELMNSGGITSRLVKFSQMLIGHIRGGLSLVCVMVNMLMAGVSGSAVADASATGTVLIPAMKKDGYNVDYAAALVAAAATIGPIIPPSIPMIVFAVISNASIGKLFLSGAIPGLLMGLALMGICYYYARRFNYPKLPRPTMAEALRTVKESFLAVIMPLVIVGGIVFGIATVTETAGIAVAYAVVVGGFIYRELKLKDVPRMLLDSAVMSAVVMITLATASAFAWLMTVLQIGDKMVAIITPISDNPMVILLIINMFFLLIGCVFEPLPAMFIFVPMLLPLVKLLGIDLTHFGLIVVFNLMLGLLTPPVGLNFFITATIAKRPPEAVISWIWPFFFVLLGVLILCTCVPDLVLWLPRVLMP
ncbi:MAG: TRAP transporter large permease [Deltaproteobacteria bacterium]|nr:TRAP transporter large permease [Deltaproteobacteria bacterium]